MMYSKHSEISHSAHPLLFFRLNTQRVCNIKVEKKPVGLPTTYWGPSQPSMDSKTMWGILWGRKDVVSTSSRDRLPFGDCFWVCPWKQLWWVYHSSSPSTPNYPYLLVNCLVINIEMVTVQWFSFTACLIYILHDFYIYIRFFIILSIMGSITY